MNSNQTNRNRKGIGPGLPFSFWYVLVAIGFLLVIQNVLFARPFEQLPYSDFKAALRQDRIEDASIRAAQLVHAIDRHPDVVRARR